MKKTFITASLLMSMMVAGVASANEFLPETNKIKSDIQTVMVSPGSTKNGPQYVTIDRNPTGYNKQVVGGRTIEGRIKDGVAYTAINGVTTKAYRINKDLQTVMVSPGSTKNGPQYVTIDRNPTGYNKQVVGGQTIESWIKDGVAYTAVDGVTAKAYRINKDLQTVVVRPGSTKNGPEYVVIDRNHTGYNKQVIGGHTIEGWIKDDVVYTAVDGVIVKKGTQSAGVK
ncbi:hypothetical protein [Sporomusa sp.]|uniref:hypothetical protein n=1 Tax=Sporomusa sp. TaxID=2078658 RepID=UPI002C1A359C|nr:hypothetical protein [Sporomusa sp.]HWR42442.1 hypothetical protein [Sporomusa sp.]